MSNNKDNFTMADLSSALNEEDRADLVNALKNKIQSLAGQHTDVLESLSPNVRKRVEVLREIQRYDIVNGVAEVEGLATETAAETEEDKEKGVPAFWLTAMKNNEVLAEEISERDEGALKYLKDIKWSRIESPKGFKLEFFFDTNPYFKNSVLTKTYHMIDEDEPILEKAIGTEIEWHPGKCLTQKQLKKKPKKGAKNAKPITKTEHCESFFNFFNPPQVPEDDEDIDEDLGFDVDPIPGPRFLGPRICGGLYPMTCIDDDEIRDELTDCSKSAMESYNKNKNTNYQYVDFVKANVRGAAGAMYFITFQAKDPSDGSCVIFQAQVWRTIKDTNEVMLCRIKPTQ